jgi:GCN5-like protein 1 (GCN5L1)
MRCAAVPHCPAQVHETQRQIEREARQLRRELTALTTHLGRWSGRSAALVGALKTAGDLQHYAARLAAEATALASVLVPAEPGQGGSSSGGGGGNSSSSCSDHPVSSAGCTGEVAAPAGAAGSGSGLVTGVPTGAALLPPASLPASVSSEATQSVTQHAK